MKKQCTMKAVAMFLIFSICISLLPSSVFAISYLDESEIGITTNEVYINDVVDEAFDGTLSEADVPEIIGYEGAVAKNHIARLYEDEGSDLNKVVFLNSDGTKTMYLFDFPVKYIDEAGSVEDIQLKISEDIANSGEFLTAANDVITRFSANFTDGISLTGNGTELRLVPVLPTASYGSITTTTTATEIDGSTNITAQLIDENTVGYYYDDATTVEYALTYTGFKEDIVVSEYTGQTEYPFRLYTNGLALEDIDGSYFLVDDSGDIQATIGDIIIFTADERNNDFGKIVPTTIVEKEEYLLTIVVDADYLADPNTMYPIRIDPTVEIDYNDGTSVIEDITITTNTNYTGSHTSLYVGRRSSEGIARALMRFPGLDLTGLEGATVTSASVRMRDLMCEDTPLDISCHVFTGSVWDANSATWSSVSPNSYVSTALSTNTLSWSIGDTFDPIHWYYFDITSAVQGWIDGNYTQNKGIIFKASSAVENGSTIANRTFGSFNRASYKPSLSVTYYDGVTSVTLSPTSISMTAGYTRTLTATISPSTAGNQNVTWSTSNSSVASVSTTGVVTGNHPGQATITCTSNDSGAKATCTVTVNPSTSSYLTLSEGSTWSALLSKGIHFWYTFTPSETGYYMFRSSSTNSVDVKAYLYNSTRTTQLAYDDDGADESRQFEIRYKLTGGTTYRLKVQGYFTSTTGGYSVTVSKCWPVVSEPTMYSRSDWGASSVITDRLIERDREPLRIIFHHSAEKFSSTDLQDCKDEIKRIQTLHMGSEEKCDIAYHFIIDPAGRIWKGAEIDGYKRGHATNYFDDIGVLVLGDFERRLANFWNPNTLNSEQKSAMVTIAQWLCYEYELPISGVDYSPVTTHRQVNPGSTVCPGENMAPYVETTLLEAILEWRK